MKTHALILILSTALLSGLTQTSPAQAQDDDKLDGALWQFTMTPKGRGPAPLSGRFRVSDNVLYQKTSPQAKGFQKKVGKNYPNGGHTRVELDDFRAFEEDKTLHSGLKGKLRMSRDAAGEWSGVFTDGEGRNWDFHCTRVQE